MSQLSKMKHSRNQWKRKAKQRGNRERYQRKQNTRLKAERNRVTSNDNSVIVLAGLRAGERVLLERPGG